MSQSVSQNDSSSESHAANGSSAARSRREGDDAYRKGLTPRHIRMIAIGGAIGTGLFLGAGGRIATAGPALVVAYAVTGLFAFFMLRAMGELVLHRPTSGSFVSYAREMYGDKLAFVAGWMYWIQWALASIVDVTAAAIYVHYWSFFTSVPQWLLAFAALTIVLTINLLSVKFFGELEFWFAIIKVGALVTFLLVGSMVLAFQYPISGARPGLHLIADHGGWLPNGMLPLVLVVVGVTFAYSGIELVGIAAGETKDPVAVMPKAVNSILWRIAVFYVGSVLLLVLLLPNNMYSASESPFVTFFDRIGIPSAGNVMNFVVLTAALSSLNAGLYSTGRILRSMAMKGAAPRFTAKMSQAGVPIGGVILTAFVTLIGVGLNYIVPSEAFEIAINVSALGVLSTWSVICLCQIKLHSRARRGEVARPAFKAPGSPYTSYATLGFLACILGLMAIDYPIGTYTVSSLVIIVPALTLGWYAIKRSGRSESAESL
ncbi:amino acid permease [Rhodococcus opacus]|uniref:L-asparagine permease n=1 Tax=Rhodococcus opacus (strain B4) TaxID=632772 RepID=C1B653_RHOOB|nr:amino acid permease [Rhodococcus opacus]BAH55464.1 L-asparagine permease [Rhodococcus opacus B4]